MVNKKLITKIKKIRKVRKYKHHKYKPTIPTLIGAGLTPDDAFYFAEEGLRKGGRFLGKKVLGYKKNRRIDRQNKLLQTVKWLESKTHRTHSGFQKTQRWTHQKTKNGIIDVPYQKFKKRIKRLV